MAHILKGNAHRFEPNDDINTDYIISGRYKFKIDEMADLAKHVMEDIDPGFAARVRPGDLIVAGRNFGCGSSREHAPWALEDYGIRAIIAPSYADIFYNNCFKNGILPIKVSKEIIAKLMDDASRGSNAIIEIDLEKQEIKGPDGGTVHFEIDPFRKKCLMEGLDDIGLTMEKKSDIDDFERRQSEQQPWLHGAA